MSGLQRDPFFYAHVLAVVGASAWLLTSSGPLVIGIPAVMILAGAAVYTAVRERRTGEVIDILRFPLPLFLADLAFASLWMIVSARNDRSIAFIVVLFIGALASQSWGRRAITLTIAAFFIGRVGEEAYRVSLGTPTPTGQLVSEISVVLLAVVVFAATLRSFARVRERGDAALRRIVSLERVARDLTAETDPAAVLRSIPASALALVPAQYAALVMRRGDHFEIAAGAGLADRVVGMHRGTDEGIFSEVLRARATVALDDYREHPRAVPAARDTGIRSTLGVPIFVHGELAACLVVARTMVRPFDAEERSAVEGFAAHASIAISNARVLGLSRRLERLARVMPGWATAESVFELTAREAADAFGTEFSFVVAFESGGTRIVGGIGAAAELVGRSFDRPGPLARQVFERRELIFVRDYLTAFPAPTADQSVHVDPEDRRGGAGLIARESGIHAVVAAPILIADAVAAVLVVGTAEPSRTFNEIDRQGIGRMAEVAAGAVATIRGRARRERRMKRLTVLNDLATRLAGAPTVGRVARLAWEAAGELVERDAFYVAQYDSERRLFHFVLQEDVGTTEEPSVSEGWDTEMVVPLGEGPTSRVILTGQPHVSRTGDGVVPPRRFGDRTRPSAEAIHVPLRQGERVVGVLSSQSYRAGAYEEEDVEILQSLANLVAGAFENISQLVRLRDLYLATVKALAAAVDARDPYTRSHSARVAALSRLMAEEMHLSEDDVRRVQLGALLHDIGKIGIPDAILNKPSALSPEEWVVMRSHPLLGASILEAVEPLADLVPIVRDHHEYFNGGGYPAGKAGPDVALLPYIVAVADAYEVIVSKRSYKEAQSVEFAISELRRCRGTQFHPDVVDSFLRVIERDLAQGTRLLARVGALQQEEIEDVPGPGDLLQRYVARAQTHGRRLAVLQRLAGEIGAVLDIDDLASRLLRIVCDAMGYEHGFLTTLDRDTNELVVRAAFGPSDHFVGVRIPRGSGISAWVLEHGRLQNVGDVRADPRFYGPSDVLSNLIVPLRIEDEVVGVLGIESARRNAFSADDEQLLTAVSHQIAAAIRVANLHSVARNAAATDPLTGLANRRAFFERLDTALAASSRDGSILTVAIADADGLKDLNDRHGHRAGDEGLIRIGEVLLQGVRSGDLVARIGGDEFAILFHGPIFVADRVMRRVAESLAASRLTGEIAVPQISWGLAQVTGTATSDEVMETADRAMYRHKRRERLLRAE